IDDASQTSQAWRLFSELVDVELDAQIEDEAKALVSEQLILNWEALNEDNVSEFACDLNYCYISLEGGSEIYVDIQDLNCSRRIYFVRTNHQSIRTEFVHASPYDNPQ